MQNDAVRELTIICLILAVFGTWNIVEIELRICNISLRLYLYIFKMENQKCPFIMRINQFTTAKEFIYL